MTRSSPQVHPAIHAFTVSFRPRRVGKSAIRAWIAMRVKMKRPDQVRKWLMKEIRKAEVALIDLAPIKTQPRVDLAQRNAQKHLKWAQAVKTELLELYPSAKGKLRRPRPGPRSRIRVGTLAREAEVFSQPDRKDGDG